ncbi:hypothetical protein B0T14DRAFT_264902 [Immersiella caudata]|uniref:Uncharacterized protein n=1 Tax=Immersiella caudata TaxID=314043 RepID=A0AA39WKX5_9PEZI|nr:hypothetical protein B0T14DRAFT_264902 [Immersiella caudata]
MSASSTTSDPAMKQTPASRTFPEESPLFASRLLPWALGTLPAHPKFAALTNTTADNNNAATRSKRRREDTTSEDSGSSTDNISAAPLPQRRRREDSRASRNSNADPCTASSSNSESSTEPGSDTDSGYDSDTGSAEKKEKRLRTKAIRWMERRYASVPAGTTVRAPVWYRKDRRHSSRPHGWKKDERTRRIRPRIALDDLE